MRLVVIGGTGLVGSALVKRLREDGQEVVAASPATGVNTLTGKGLRNALNGASVVVDVTNAPSWEDEAAMYFFYMSTRNLLKYEAAAGVKHHVVLSVVGTERLFHSGYFRAKWLQENFVKHNYSISYSIIRATQFFEFLKEIADCSTEGTIVRLPSVLFQPIAVDDVASALAGITTGSPVNGALEIGGPEQFRLDELVRRYLVAHKDPREVLADPDAPYFGSPVSEWTLLPNDDARISQTRFADWLEARRSKPKDESAPAVGAAETHDYEYLIHYHPNRVAECSKVARLCQRILRTFSARKV